MNAFWVAPAVVLVVGMFVGWYLAREASVSGRELRESVERFGQVRDDLTRLQGEVGGLRRGLPARRHQ